MTHYQVQYVGGGWDRWVVFDATKGSVASCHSRHNWVTSFPDNVEAYHFAMKRAEELNHEPPDRASGSDVL